MKRLLASLQRKHAAVLCVAVLACVPLDPRTALSALLGGLLQAASLWSLERSVEAWLRRAQEGAQSDVSMLTWVRLPALLLTVGAVLYALPVDPLGFTLGLSAVVPAALWHGLVPAGGEV
jgi:hypothetical protein